jgi:hypothetical protein
MDRRIVELVPAGLAATSRTIAIKTDWSGIGTIVAIIHGT